MKTEIVSITKSMGRFAERTIEELVSDCARVSNMKNQGTDAIGLLGYLIKNKHWSPFEMVNMCVEITTSRAISAQFMRHRSFSFQEFSQRYSEVVEFEPVQLRMQAETNRQSSTVDVEANNILNTFVDEALNEAESTYQRLIEAGVSRETARMILPMTSQTTFYMNGTLRSWLHFLEVRNHSHAQREAQDIAKEIEVLMLEHFPVITKAVQMFNASKGA
jgi:thymidylate synthase (FAD)